MPVFPLVLQKTYYEQGFFNVTVDFDQYVRQSDGSISLVIGEAGQRIQGKINRRANMNGTARIMGGRELRDWFKSNFSVLDRVDVDLGSSDAIHLSKPKH